MGDSAMGKKLIGIAILVFLIGLLTYNVVSTKSAASEDDASGNAETTGAVAYSDNATFLDVGDTVPDFEMETLDGKKLKLSEFQGKKVILNFWTTWCPPCKKEMPEIEKFYQNHRQDVEIVAVNLTGTEKNAQHVRQFIDKHQYSFPVYLDRTMEVSENLAFTIPTTYFIGTDGKIQQPRHVGPMTYEVMANTLKKLH